MDFFEKSLNDLKTERKIFHSEDDLKLSLALKLKENNPKLNIRLEKPIDIEMIDRSDKKSIVRAPIDMILIDENNHTYPIELKYKTKKLSTIYNGETFNLTKHGAADIGRFSFRKDIYRIEKYKTNSDNCPRGYVLIVTNDKSYFQDNVFDKNNLDKHFSFHDGFLINKIDSGWNYEKINQNKYSFTDKNIWVNQQLKIHWTYKKELFYKLDLQKDYRVKWNEYSKIENNEFKYCLIEI